MLERASGLEKRPTVELSKYSETVAEVETFSSSYKDLLELVLFIYDLDGV
jgi:hypothetical protein